MEGQERDPWKRMFPSTSIDANDDASPATHISLENFLGTRRAWFSQGLTAPKPPGTLQSPQGRA